MLQRRLVALLTAAVVRLLDLVDAVVDLLVADVDTHVRSLLHVLGVLKQVRHGLALQGVVLSRAGLRERLLRTLVALLRPREQRYELVLLHLLAADDDDVVRAEGRGAAATAASGEDEHDDESESGEECAMLHGKAAICSGFFTLLGGRPV